MFGKDTDTGRADAKDLPRPSVDDAELERRFTYHPPKPEQVSRYAEINDRTLELAKRIRDLTPAGREQALALTALEEARMRANQAIATGES